MRCRMCRMTWFLVLKVAYGQQFSTFSVLANQNTKRPSFCQLESWTACQTKISPSQVPNSGRKVPNSGRKVPNSGRKVPGCGKKVPRLGILVGQCCCFFLKMLLQLFFKNVVVADLIVVSVDEVGGLQCCILPDYWAWRGRKWGFRSTILHILHRILHYVNRWLIAR